MESNGQNLLSQTVQLTIDACYDPHTLIVTFIYNMLAFALRVDECQEHARGWSNFDKLTHQF